MGVPQTCEAVKVAGDKAFAACYLAGMEDQGRWEGPFQPGDPDGPKLTNRTYQSNTVNLYTDGNEILAMIVPDPVTGLCSVACADIAKYRKLSQMVASRHCGRRPDDIAPEQPYPRLWRRPVFRRIYRRGYRWKGGRPPH